MTDRPDVLVVGAGPAGLTTALQACAHGASVRIVERRREPFRPSRAMIVHPRTLESLRPLGVVERLLRRGDPSPSARLHLGRRVVSTTLADVALRDTAFPHLTLLRQADVEQVLAEALEERGVPVERGVAAVGLAQDRAEATVTLRRDDGGAEPVSCGAVAGCDGQDSTVRRATGIDWRGRAYREEVVLADLDLDSDLDAGVLHVAAGRDGLVFLFALGEGAPWRLLATRPSRGGDAPFGQPGQPVPRPELRELLDVAGFDVAVGRVAWSARVRLQHRLAAAFRHGRVFLVGDAAHTHSPAAAQGMNTGILDAVNLGWKLPFAAHADEPDTMLDSYERERRPVARQVLALTHLVFFAEAAGHPAPAFLRGTVAPLLAPVVPSLTRPTLLAPVVRLLSQGWVRYRGSALSSERWAGGPGPRAGDRLPDETVTCDGMRTRLHRLTARPGVHVLLARDAEEVGASVVEDCPVSVHRLTSRPGRRMVAVRPDGHVGFRGTAVADLTAWLRLVGARARSADTATQPADTATQPADTATQAADTAET
ncbi:FAD-dependent oxidoreductase [Saccharomonospora piscinae]|uniref:FAD-dependent monooxygenase n=1 Tax=Saccharomonospora piscinae TaxID=687388 RepID=UPI00110625C3|nr:FAD-dependent monooxygenase [Saccharomonospora piscinae]TLW93117.1 FAD-dependent oxidoreductase [Saccharomonospora piscinae]